MKVRLVTGTMGSGKTKYIFDIKEEITQKYHDSIIFLKHKDRIIDGDFIKSRAYEETIPCEMVENLNILKNNETSCVVIDEYQYFTPKDLKSFLEINKNKEMEVILTGLAFFANGNIWQSYSAVLQTCVECGIICEEIKPQDARCYYTECKDPAIKHMLKENVVPDFGKLDIDDFNLCCEKHYIAPTNSDINYNANFVRSLQKTDIIKETLDKNKKKDDKIVVRGE